MTIAIAVRVPDGIVFGTDSRTISSTNRVVTDSATKLFQLGDRIGAITADVAYLQNRSIHALVEQFKSGLRRPLGDPEEAANRLAAFFQAQYDAEVAAIGGTTDIGPLHFVVGGYRRHDALLFRCELPGPRVDPQGQANEPGSMWLGQTDVIQRLLLCYDPRLDLSAMPDALRQPLARVLEGLRYRVYLGLFSLQDAVDFCRFLIETTIKMQRFADGIEVQPGDRQGVGGEVDVALITPDNGFQWVRRKAIRA